MTDEQEYAALKGMGGVPVVQAGTDPDDPASIEWNFGLTGAPVKDTRPSFGDVAPALAGRWDGKTRINAHASCRKVLGKDLDPQFQPRGSCGGRAGSGALDVLQCNLITAGARSNFQRVSHAWLYYLARREFNMLGGGDGVAGGSIPPVMMKYGSLARAECGDDNYYGEGSDDLAVALGGGRRKPPESWFALAADSIAKHSAPIRTRQEAGDGLLAGGTIVLSGTQGFTMERNGDGCCAQRGTWYHYLFFTGVGLTPSGRIAWDYNQSAGRNTPSGPLREGCPGNVFGIYDDAFQSMLDLGEGHLLYGWDGWDPSDIPSRPSIPWIF